MKVIWICLGLLAYVGVEAQVVFQDTIYINSDNRVINDSIKSEAYSYLVRKLNKQNQLHGNIIRYYNNGQVFEHYQYDNGKKNGPFSTFTAVGKPLVKGQFRQGKKTGIEEKWHDNGQKHYTVEYVNNGLIIKQKVINEWDETGDQKIKDGVGFLTLNYPVKGYFEEGSYQGGYKEGDWFGTYLTGERYFIESYHLGEMLGGTSFDKSGQTFDYDRVNYPAAFRGGMGGWEEYLYANRKYPRKMMKKKLQAGVGLSFDIEKDGTVTNVKVIEPTLPDFDREAIRLMEESPKWVSAQHRGQKITTTFQTIIPFKLEFDERGNIRN